MADPTNLFGVPVPQELDNARPALPETAGTPPQSHRYEEKSGKHKGVAGVARDVLGFLGDFLLTRLRMPAMYGPDQKQRQLESAWQGHEEDPQAAIDRVTDVDFATGNKMNEQRTDNLRQQALVDSTRETRDARMALATDARDVKIRGYGASMLGSMTSWSDEKKKAFYPQMRAQVVGAGKRQGLDLSAELPEEYDPVTLDAFIDAAVPVGTQRAQRLTSERDAKNYGLGVSRLKETKDHNDATEKVSQQNADTSAGRADETERHNREGEDQKRTDSGLKATQASDKQKETKRHNQATEPIERLQKGFVFRYVNGKWVNKGPK